MINENILTLSNNLRTSIDKQRKNKFRYFYNKSVYNSKFLFINSLLKEDFINKSPYRNILINYLIKAENVLKGSSELLSDLTVSRINRLPIDYEKAQSRKKTLYRMFEQIISDGSRLSLIKSIIEFTGPDGSIKCQSTKNNEINVLKSQKPEININILDSFINIYFNKQKEITKNFIAICMDAYIERESEISPLIDTAIKNKQNVIIFARGYSEYFKVNIKNIILKNSVCIYPYEVKFSNDDPFLLDDIARLLGTEKYSAESGDSITKNILNKSCLCSLKVSSEKVVFLNSNSADITKEIDKKLKIVEDLSLKTYLLKRKKRLTNNTTIVNVPYKDVTLLEEIKSAIAYYNSAATSGFIIYKGRIYPRKSFLFVLKLSENLNNNLKNIGCVVKLNDKKQI
jgi:hypothetical protein